MIDISVIAVGGVAVVKQNQILISAPTAVQSYVEVNDMKHYWLLDNHKFGVNMFFTREEAEKALKESEENA